MSATNPKTIELYGHGIQREAKALDDITPGMLVERADGGVQPVLSANATFSMRTYANEYGLTGLTINDTYEADDQVIFTTYAPGSAVYAIVAAGAAAITEGAYLKAVTGGTVAAAGAEDTVVAQALEAVDNSGEATPARIKIEIV